MTLQRLASFFAAGLLALAASAQQKDYSLKIDDFNELKVVDGINVVYHTDADSSGMVTFTCDPATADKLIFESSKKRLKIEVAIDDQGTVPDLPVVHVRSSMLTRVENSGDSTVTVDLNGPVQSFKARIVGNGTLIVRGVYANNAEGRISTGHGHLVMQGRAATAKLSNIGTGPIEAGSLDAKDVKCWVLGTGPIDCRATERLHIVGAGSGKVYYAGNPSEVTNRTIGVKAIAIEN